jgi:hypothetical protein
MADAVVRDSEWRMKRAVWWADLRGRRGELLVEEARVLSVHAQELVFPGFYFAA